MFTRIVVPIDPSSDGEEAVPVALALGRQAQLPIELLTVVEPVDRGMAEGVLRRVALDAGADDLEVRVVESGGAVEAALLTEVHRGDGALWCVGSHARGPIGELVFGSVSEQLVRDAHCPILLVGPHVGVPSGRVLVVAVDGTHRGEAILPAAHELAGTFGMSVRIVQVLEPLGSDVPGDVAETAYLARVAAAPPAVDDYEVLHARHAAKELADYVERQADVGILALSSRGLKGGARLLHGGTAYDLTRHARVPVLILHVAEE